MSARRAGGSAPGRPPPLPVPPVPRCSLPVRSSPPLPPVPGTCGRSLLLYPSAARCTELHLHPSVHRSVCPSIVPSAHLPHLHPAPALRSPVRLSVRPSVRPPPTAPPDPSRGFGPIPGAQSRPGGSDLSRGFGTRSGFPQRRRLRRGEIRQKIPSPPLPPKPPARNRPPTAPPPSGAPVAEPPPHPFPSRTGSHRSPTASNRRQKVSFPPPPPPTPHPHPPDASRSPTPPSRAPRPQPPPRTAPPLFLTAALFRCPAVALRRTVPSRRPDGADRAHLVAPGAGGGRGAARPRLCRAGGVAGRTGRSSRPGPTACRGHCRSPERDGAPG